MIRENRTFTQREDQIIIDMFQTQGIKNWGMIAEALTTRHNFPRNAKQCRDRFHQFLQKTTAMEWTEAEQQKLYRLHEEVGNKWASISVYFPGKTDNSVKNHFYSKLRKALRHLNKSIKRNFKKQYKELKIASLYKIIESLEEKFQQTAPIDQQKYTESLKLKRELLAYADASEKQPPPEVEHERSLIARIEEFDRVYKRKSKLEKKNSIKSQDLFKSVSGKQSQESFCSDYGSSGSQYSFALSHGDEELEKNQEKMQDLEGLIVIEEDLRESKYSNISEMKSLKSWKNAQNCEYMLLDQSKLRKDSRDYPDNIEILLREKCVIEEVEHEEEIHLPEGSKNSMSMVSQAQRLDMFGDDIRISEKMHQMGIEPEEEDGDYSIFRSHR